MSKKLACGDLVEGCAFHAEAGNEDELMKKVAAHAAEKHGVKEVTPELAAKLKAAIRTGA